MSHCAWNSSGHDGPLKSIEPEVQVKVFLAYHVLPLALVSVLIFILASMLLYLYCYRNSVYEYWGRCQTVPGIPPDTLDTLVHWPKDPMSGFLPRSCIPQCTVVCSATHPSHYHIATHCRTHIDQSGKMPASIWETCMLDSLMQKWALGKWSFRQILGQQWNPSYMIERKS